MGAEGGTGRLRKFNEAVRAKVCERNNGLIPVREQFTSFCFLIVHDSSVAGTYHTDDPINHGLQRPLHFGLTSRACP